MSLTIIACYVSFPYETEHYISIYILILWLLHVLDVVRVAPHHTMIPVLAWERLTARRATIALIFFALLARQALVPHDAWRLRRTADQWIKAMRNVESNREFQAGVYGERLSLREIYGPPGYSYSTARGPSAGFDPYALPWHHQLGYAREVRFDPADVKKLPLPYRWEHWGSFYMSSSYLPILEPGDDPHASHRSARYYQHIFEVRADGADTLLIGTFVTRSWGVWLCTSRQVRIKPNGDTARWPGEDSYIPCAVTLPE